MLKNFYSHELPEASMRPRWCRDEDTEKWWLPWEVHAILETLNGHVPYQTGIHLSNNTNIGIGRVYTELTDMEMGLGLITGTWEDELFPEAWATKGHTETCTSGPNTCNRQRYYSLTPRGRQWLETIPVRARPPRWKRPTWWVGVIFWTTATFLVLRAFLNVV